MPFHETGYNWKAGTDEHDTPATLFEPISNAIGGFDLDPSASPTSDLADTNLTKEDNGLDHKWAGKVWLNPPYSDVATWLQKAYLHHTHGHTDLTVCLIYARTGTQWYHNYVRNAQLRCFIEGRVSFGDGNGSAPAPSMIAVFGEYPPELRKTLERKGEVLTE